MCPSQLLWSIWVLWLTLYFEAGCGVQGYEYAIDLVIKKFPAKE